MTTTERIENVENTYFDWMVNIVCRDTLSKDISYRRLLSLLHSMEFKYSITMDENRMKDGLSLRYRFGYCEHNMELSNLIEGPCSVLEMMIALAFRCEEIMDDPRYGDRMPQWFWMMIANLGLNGMYDTNFNKKYVIAQVEHFLNHEYAPDGKGGLFVVRHSYQDMRTIEIWAQMQEFLNELA